MATAAKPTSKYTTKPVTAQDPDKTWKRVKFAYISVSAAFLSATALYVAPVGPLASAVSTVSPFDAPDVAEFLYSYKLDVSHFLLSHAATPAPWKEPEKKVEPEKKIEKKAAEPAQPVKKGPDTPKPQ